MPHDVIMPALGMAQDTGLLVAWHKQPGDKVKSGDVLMEVETDKAAMEVEAQADGYLADIRAGEGDNVPVGDVVAVIADQPGETAKKAETAEASAPVTSVDGKEIIMPALGMAQDTGLIVAWHKAPGDAVAAGDVLLEVETDKSVMEVEAGHDGFVAELRAEAGENVPVGDVIAVITADKPEAPIQRKAAEKQESEPQPREETASSTKAETPQPAPKRIAAQPFPGGRILASPKARRLATERGLDLARLAAEGHPQPYHAADLDRLAALPAPSAAAPANAADRVEARVAKTEYDAFRTWLAGESDGEIDGLAILAAFAAASLRSAAPARERPLVAEAQKPLSQRSVRFADPDLCGLSAIDAVKEDATPALILRDLTGSAVIAARFGASAVPAISVADSENAFEIVLDSPAGILEPEAAIAIVQEMAARLQDPMRHLL
jgi:pyruvate/2-oxoglutarate dehydrogenase complex dihydrolipoamide acyltransferase (E2) component